MMKVRLRIMFIVRGLWLYSGVIIPFCRSSRNFLGFVVNFSALEPARIRAISDSSGSKVLGWSALNFNPKSLVRLITFSMNARFNPRRSTLNRMSSLISDDSLSQVTTRSFVSGHPQHCRVSVLQSRSNNLSRVGEISWILIDRFISI